MDICFRPIMINNSFDFNPYLSFINIISRYYNYKPQITFTYDNFNLVKHIDVVDKNKTYTISKIQQSLDEMQQKISCTYDHVFIINDDVYKMAKNIFVDLFNRNIVKKNHISRNFCVICNKFLEENEYCKSDSIDMLYKIKYNDIYITTHYPEFILDDEIIYYSNSHDDIINPITGKNIIIKNDINIINPTRCFTNKLISKNNRKIVLDKLEELKLLEKINTNYTIRCDHCGNKVEQNVDHQWTIDTSKLNININTNNIYPKEYREKVEDIIFEHERNWCISSNLVYGLQIPIHYCPLCDIYTLESTCDNICGIKPDGEIIKCGNTNLNYDNTVFLPSFINLLTKTNNTLIAYNNKDVCSYLVHKLLLYGDIYDTIFIYDNEVVKFSIKDTLMYLSKNVTNFEKYHKIPVDYDVTNLDIWILSQLNKLVNKISKHNNNYFFIESLKKIQNFTAKKLIPNYLNFVKPNLKDSNVQKTLSIILYYLLRMTKIYEPTLISEIFLKHNIQETNSYVKSLVLDKYSPVHDIMNEILKEIKIKLISYDSNEFILDSDNKELLEYIKTNIGIVKNKVVKTILYNKESMEQNVEYISINMYDIIIYIKNKNNTTFKNKSKLLSNSTKFTVVHNSSAQLNRKQNKTKPKKEESDTKEEKSKIKSAKIQYTQVKTDLKDEFKRMKKF